MPSIDMALRMMQKSIGDGVAVTGLTVAVLFSLSEHSTCSFCLSPSFEHGFVFMAMFLMFKLVSVCSAGP